MFLKEIRNIFVSATNVARAGKQGNICVRNIVSLFATTLTLASGHVNLPEKVATEGNVKYFLPVIRLSLQKLLHR